MSWWGMTRREENHQRWESRDTRGAIKAKAREAQRQALAKEARKKQVRHQRNNRREY